MEFQGELTASMKPLSPGATCWEFFREKGEDPESFLNILGALGSTHRKRVADLPDSEHVEHRSAAEDLARDVFLWRLDVNYPEDRADTPRAKGLWGELVVLSHLETEQKVENASTCWRPFGSKWDIEVVDGESKHPIEVKTTMRNTHTHELRHSQLNEGRKCGLSLFSVRCAEDGSGSGPTLEELLQARGADAAQLGERGADCVKRVELELSRLSPKEKGLRLRQEGVIVSVKVAGFPGLSSHVQRPEVHGGYRARRRTDVSGSQ
jgi:hypothetical protein